MIVKKDKQVEEKLPPLSPEPKLRLHFDDLSHPATASFLSLIDCSRLLSNSTKDVLRHLYKPCKDPKIPGIRSVTLVLRPMGGVAYTTGLEIDDLHKEIHVSLDYISTFGKEPLRCRDEIIGVATHEMVHVWQHNCLGTAPGGLIEGIADYVRLRSGLAPPHWKGAKDEIGDKWDSGYQKTAYFLEWLERTYGDGTIAKMNQAMCDCKYDETIFWPGLFGADKNIEFLWKSYRDSFKENDSKSKREMSTQDEYSTSTRSLGSEPVAVELTHGDGMNA